MVGAPQPSETSNVASSVPVIDVETSKRQFAERNKIGVDVKGSPGGTGWTLTSKDLMKEAPGGVAWQANPEEVVYTSVNTKRAAPKSAAQTVQESVNGTASHALSTCAVSLFYIQFFPACCTMMQCHQPCIGIFCRIFIILVTISFFTYIHLLYPYLL